ncbi:MAG: hypothetical protein FWE21_00055 [Defluviitaleaceae bacterium]|nr:hypothetical protein [Defluviitaleaceae bacterium]
MKKGGDGLKNILGEIEAPFENEMCPVCDSVTENRDIAGSYCTDPDCELYEMTTFRWKALQAKKD